MKRFLIISTFVVIAGGLLLLKWMNSSRTAPESAATKGGKQPPVSVTAHIVRAGSFSNTLKVTGTVIANQEVTLQSEVAGRVVKINFREGKPVRKGDLLLKIQDDEMQAQLKKLELQKTLAEKNEARQKQLLDINGVSQQEYDIVHNQLRTIEAEITLLKTTIEKTNIYAPFSGTIGLKSISEGAYLTPSTVIASLQEINPVKIDFSIPEKYIQMVKQGDTLQFTVGSSKEIFNATILAVEPRIDPATRTVQIRATCQNPERKIFPGAYADITLPLDAVEGALMVPTQSVIAELKGNKIFLAKSGKAVPVKVETGMRNDSTIQILGGIHPGDTILTTGLMGVRPGSDLKIVKLN